MNGNDLDRRFVETAIFVVLRVLRRKKLLTPADLTDLRVALEHRRVPDDLVAKAHRLLAEQPLEREDRRETPRKPV